MQYLGDKSPGSTFTFWFTTADASGAPTALSSGAISAYKDNSDTQDTDGITLSASADSVTGANRVVVNTAADGTFYSSGSDFTLMLTAGTVDGNSVAGYVVGRFTLGVSSGDANSYADALLDRSAGVETNLTPRQFFRLAAAVLFGKASGLNTTTAVYRDYNDGVNRISATVDEYGNRSAVTRVTT